jgi:uncharacterized protein (TIGR04255 family)
VALCQLRFPIQLGFGDDDVRPIQADLSARYPRVDREVQQLFQITPERVEQVQTAETVYRLRSDDATWVVTLASTFVTLETTNYHRFSEFLERWIEVFDSVTQYLGVERQERLGLRYVNELAVPEATSTVSALQRMLRPELLGPITAQPVIEEPVTSMQELRFRHAIGMATLRHGLQRNDRDEPIYLVDTDIYDDTARALDREQQLSTMKQFNKTAYDLFRSSVTDEQFKTFEPEEEAQDAAA